MTPEQQAAAAQSLRDAARTGEFVTPLRETYPTIDAAAAYAVQRLNTEWRLQQGRRAIGCKIGLTARSVQAQLGVDRPDFGMLFDDMGYGDSEPIPASILQQPKIEAEVAFVLGRDLERDSPTMVDLINAIEYALPALEIVGSRIANWNIKFVDTVADNASSGAYVLGGSPRKISDFDLRLCGMVMTRRGEPVSTGAGAACLGNPLNAVLWLARTMAELGSPLRAGDLVLSGALGPMVPVQPGDVIEARINGLGAVKAIFEPKPVTGERSMNRVDELAALLDEAADEANEVDQIDPEGKLSLADAYQIQAASIQRRVQRGERRVGVKMGFTSRAKMVQMGIDDVIWGRLSSGMQVEEGTPIRFSRYVHPRVEPEIAFMLKKPLGSRVTLVEALAAVEAIAPALEIIDSRYRNFKFSLPDVIADNASSSGFVIGPWCRPDQDFSNLGLTLCIDGRVVQVGSTAAILGHPLRSLVAAARLSADAGEPLQAGWVVMAGGATPAEWIKPGQYVSVEMEALGSAGFSIEA